MRPGPAAPWAIRPSSRPQAALRVVPDPYKTQRPQHVLGQGVLACGIGAHARAEQHVRAALHQGDEAKLRVGATAATRAGPAEGLLVVVLVGHIHRSAE